MELADRKNCVAFQKQTVKGCYCLDIMIAEISEHGVITGAQNLYNNFGDVCGKFAQQYVIAGRGQRAADFVNLTQSNSSHLRYALAQTLVIGAAAMVTVINVVLKTSIKGMASFEHHASLSAETKAVSSQIAITLFVNTALIIMIVNAYIEFAPLNAVGLLTGNAEDFDFDWYVPHKSTCQVNNSHSNTPSLPPSLPPSLSGTSTSGLPSS
jgi:hypothetical protein